jgi:hypothetical protein
VSEWQPIETAPKDGRKVLIAYEDLHGKPHCAISRWYWKRGGYWSAHAHVDVTHWMPLPSAPSDLPDGKGNP